MICHVMYYYAILYCMKLCYFKLWFISYYTYLHYMFTLLLVRPLLHIIWCDLTPYHIHIVICYGLCGIMLPYMNSYIILMHQLDYVLCIYVMFVISTKHVSNRVRSTRKFCCLMCAINPRSQLANQTQLDWMPPPDGPQIYQVIADL